MSITEIFGIPSEVDKRLGIMVGSFCAGIINVLLEKKIITEEEMLKLIDDIQADMEKKLKSS